MPVVVDNPCVAALPGGERAEARGSTARTRRLANHAVERQYGRFVELADLSSRYPEPDARLAPVLREAMRFAWIHPRQTPVIREGELIVGARVRAEDGPPGGAWYPDGFDWYLDHFARNVPPERPDLAAMAQRGLISPQGSFNHKAVDYAGYVRTGSAALAARARRMAEERTGAEREFCLAFAVGHEAIIAHAETYAEACERMAQTAEPLRAEELRTIGRICRKVPAGPAETLREALQSLWFAYMVAGDAVGRPDVYLRSFYEADLAAGRISPDDALELIECFMIKLHGDVAEGVVNVSSIQTMTLGGVLPDGSDATNDLTRLFLRAVRSVRLLRPTVYIRCHEQTPDDVLDEAMEMLGEGLAEPSFYGDRPIIEGLTRIGVPLEHARDYALSGCTEVVSPGRGNWGAPNGWINLALLCDEAIRNAASAAERPAARREPRPPAVDVPVAELVEAPAPEPDGIFRAIAEHMASVADACRDCNEWVDAQVGDCRLGATLLMPVCLDRCADVAHGGAETHYGHWEAIGLPNAAEMVCAALRCAAQGTHALGQTVERLDAGDPETYMRLARTPRFGNGEYEVDEIGARLIRMLADALERRSTSLRTCLVLGHLAGGENMHIGYGARMGATLDGRAPGQTLADSLAGSQGRTRNGPTAVIRSLCALDHSRMVAGNVSTLRLSPSEFRSRSGRDTVKALVRTFVALGGSQLQINVADAATLRAAQQRPEEHRGLLVRVAGYSADFTSIGRTLQDEIIARTEACEER
jgi:formate C-acetyltransferase